MRYLISGASGHIGGALCRRLEGAGHEAWQLVRAPGATSERSIAWQPELGSLEASNLERFDAVVHLAGENVAGHWNAAKKESIRASRVAPTALLSDAISRLRHPPAVFACASAIGYYGDRGEEMLNEESPAGTGFMADVCLAWEAATARAATSGIRTLNLRFGVVLSAEAGALHQMLPPFRLGLGGRMGNGNQFWSWISLPDAIGAIIHAVAHPTLSGPVNIVSPHPVRNREFAATLGAALHRPVILPVPAFALRLMLGELADEALLASTRVEPRILARSGYAFQHPTLAEALARVLR